MTQHLRAAGLLALAAACFSAAIFAGMRDAEAKATGSEVSPAVCCIYMIF